MIVTSITFKKVLLLCASICIIATNSTNAQVFVSEDFNAESSPALPVGWTSVPAPLWITGIPNIIAPNALSSLDYSLNSAAHTKALGINGSLAAADGATIFSPVISLPATATNAILEFDVAFFDMQSDATPPQTESLIFIISTDGGTTWSDVSFIAGASSPAISLWETKSLPMGAYAGQSNLKFGFRYNNQGGTLIGAVLDNIVLINGIDGAVISAFAGDHPDPSTGAGYQRSGTSATLKGTVKNKGSLPINSYYIRYRVGDSAIQSSPLIEVPLASMDTASFPAGLMAAIPANENYTIKTWIDATGDVDHSNDTVAVTTIGVPYFPVKKPVFEEGTGTWCGWCPRGAVFMDQFAAEHPGGVAAQIAVHNNDPMTVPAYNSYMANYAQGFPNIVIDRISVINPKDIDSAFAVTQNNFGFADVTLGAPVITGDTVSVPVSITPVINIANAKPALVITENNVKASGDNWPQNNYYSGGGSGTMGGWENEPEHVPDVDFHFVARSITPAVAGGAELPSTIVAGTTYNINLTAILDSSWKTTDLQYLALLINGNNTSIMNSAFTSLPALQNSLAVTNVENGIEQVVLYPNPTSDKSYLTCNVKVAGKAVITVSDITGRTLFRTIQEMYAGKNVMEIKTGGLAAGSYIVNFIKEGTNVNLRLQVAN